MEKTIVKDYDTADYIETKEDVLNYLDAVLEENDPDFLLGALGDILRSKGMTQIEREFGFNREILSQSFSADGNPSLKTFYKLLEVFGARLKLEESSARQSNRKNRKKKKRWLKPTYF